MYLHFLSHDVPSGIHMYTVIRQHGELSTIEKRFCIKSLFPNAFPWKTAEARLDLSALHCYAQTSFPFYNGDSNSVDDRRRIRITCIDVLTRFKRFVRR